MLEPLEAVPGRFVFAGLSQARPPAPRRLQLPIHLFLCRVELVSLWETSVVLPACVLIQTIHDFEYIYDTQAGHDGRIETGHLLDVFSHILAAQISNTEEPVTEKRLCNSCERSQEVISVHELQRDITNMVPRSRCHLVGQRPPYERTILVGASGKVERGETSYVALKPVHARS